ncbi:hypothetical protein MHBO_000295 [Bonamia ostreae]|uniref:Uncharacterized protein n=1 Tax=Bonamia ostreae TaxID=126728 RepID=A0ABV2AG02_9EUKA
MFGKKKRKEEIAICSKGHILKKRPFDYLKEKHKSSANKCHLCGEESLEDQVGGYYFDEGCTIGLCSNCFNAMPIKKADTNAKNKRMLCGMSGADNFVCPSGHPTTFVMGSFSKEKNCCDVCSNSLLSEERRKPHFFCQKCAYKICLKCAVAENV